MPDSPLIRSPSPEAVASALAARARKRLVATADAALVDLLADTIFHERKRLEKVEDPEYERLLDDAARAVRTASRGAMEAAVEALVRRYALEIHNPFSARTYRFATRILPGTLTRLLSAGAARDLLARDFDPHSRIRIEGPLERIKALVDRGATLILAPTHVSNLDSPLIGYALFAAGLPPFAYGAGLNLFSNPVMAFFMRRLGAYTVDRLKRNRLYKDTLKDYSTETLRRGTHSLFFPGGTRSRSGRIETRLKKGLLGTGIVAWRENLAEGRPRDVFVVPCTLSIGVVLEAETLIADSLEEEGKQRYIISDDEFSDATVVASFTRRLLRLDSAVHAVFGEPLDLMGNRLDAEGRSLDPHGRPVDRREYVVDRDGKVVADEQRDQVYTARLSEKLAEAWQGDFVVQSTHLSAWAAWEALKAKMPGRDTWHLVRLAAEDREVARADVERRIAAALPQLPRRVGPSDAAGVLDEALRLFANFHKKRALEQVGNQLRISPELCLYYRNRLEGHALHGPQGGLGGPERHEVAGGGR